MDCLVVGGGPAGLTAALYLARFRRRVLVIDADASRAGWIPVSHNLAGFPDGIRGSDLLAHMRGHADRYGATIVTGSVESLERGDGPFEAISTAGDRHRAARVLLATGAEDAPPPLPLPRRREAVERGRLRFCPICDAYEATGLRIGLIGRRRCRVGEALLLRGYTADLRVLTLEEPWSMSAEERSTLWQADVAVVAAPVRELVLEDGAMAVRTVEGEWHRFDALYAALGLRARSELATALGAACDEDGALAVDEHQQTTVAGLYAAGDVVQGLAQVGVAVGHAAIAATAIHNALPPIRATPRRR